MDCWRYESPKRKLGIQCLNGNNYPAFLCNIFLDLLNNHGMAQIVNFPTRASNILGIFSTNRPSLILQCKPLAGLRDHEIVFVESSLEVLHQRSPKKLTSYGLEPTQIEYKLIYLNLRTFS